MNALRVLARRREPQREVVAPSSLLRWPTRFGARRVLASAWLTLCFVTACFAAERNDPKDPKQLPAVSAKAKQALHQPPTAEITRDALDAAGLGVDLPEVLTRLPGVVALERQNEVQDSPLIVRGFGARSSFGTRGVRIELDGIPVSFADGQGQVGTLQPAQLARAQLLSGPYATVAGFNAGAVLSLYSELPNAAQVRAAWQSRGGRTLAVAWGDSASSQQYGIQASAAAQTGARPHSDSQRRTLNGQWLWLGDLGSLTVKWDGFEQPWAEDPGSLNAATLRLTPQAADPIAVQTGAGKRVLQQRLAASWQGESDARAAVYLGRRDVMQVLALLPEQQRGRPGVAGLIDLEREFFGARAGQKWASQASMLRWFADWEVQDDQRLGYENFNGQRLQQRGQLKRQEQTRFNVYGLGAEASQRWREHWFADAGLRWNRQDFRLDPAAGAGAAVGANTLEGWTGYLGFRWQPEARANWRLAWGRGLETPTATELANRPNGEAGLNLALKTPVSRQWELRHEHAFRRARFSLAAYRIETRDDLVVVENLAGRVVFGNAASTRRQGLELSWRQRLRGPWSLLAGANWADARYLSDVPFDASASASQCNPSCPPAALRLRAGARLPATPNSQVRIELNWRDGPLRFGIGWLRRGALVVDDRRQLFAPSLQRFDLYASRAFEFAGQRSEVRLQVDDLLDRGGVAGIAINEGSGRYFDPAPGRQWSLVWQLRY